MDELIKSAVLGIIQGLTEFLPVSSSGHLEIGKAVLGLDYDAKASLLMTVVLHAATALSTIVVFHRDIFNIFRGLLQPEWKEHAVFLAKIVISMVPAAIVGLKFNDQIESFFEGQLLLVGLMLLVTGALLFLAGRSKRTDKDVSYFGALIVGISQAIAILPGISRSGATISTSVMMGVDRSKAARFSFLMVVPLIMGKMAKDILDGMEGGLVSTTPIPVLIVGFIAAFATGLLACKWMIALVRNFQLWWFSLYCFVVGSFVVAYACLWHPASSEPTPPAVAALLSEVGVPVRSHAGDGRDV